ncbi:MAG: sugar transferase [Candidatus Limnocylindria bacterium]
MASVARPNASAPNVAAIEAWPDEAALDVLPAVARSRVKRALDVAVAATALTVLLPLLALISVAVMAASGWPPLFSQRRVGLGGREFRFWKFRTMVNGAEAKREELACLNEAPFPAFKITNDPRVTPIGRLLRRSSLDELPQLWNVLRGEMSLVGPRPPLPVEVAQYDASTWRRLSARPGLTGVWQIEHRSLPAHSFGEWVRKDLRYIDRWSLDLDLILIVRTIGAVVRMTGR